MSKNNTSTSSVRAENNTSTKLSAGLVPKLRFPDFKDDGEWSYLHGDELFEPIVNKNHNSDLPILAITQEQGAIPRDLIDYHVSVTDKSVESYKVVEVGDFIISLRSFQGGIEYSYYKGLCSPAYIILRKKVNLENEFYRHYFKSISFIRDLNKNLEGIRDGKMVSYKQFSEILIPKPKTQEQQKIAACLSSLDEVITTESQKLDILKDHKKGLLQNLLPQEGETAPKFRFKEFEDSGEWVERKLGEICKMQAGKFISASEIKEYNSEGFFPCYGGNGLRGYVNSITHSGKYSLIGRQGALCGNVTIADSSFHATEHAVVVIPEKVIDTLWLFYMLGYLNLNQYATGQAQPGLSVKNLEQVELAISKSIEEQKKIADTLSSIDELIKAQNQKIEALKLHKKGLLQGLFPDLNTPNSGQLESGQF
jgi:type I restriction enzyme, S subunit